MLPRPCALVVGLEWKDGEVRLNPSVTEIEQSVLDLFDKAVLSLSEIPRVECKLFSADGGQQSIASTSLDEEVDRLRATESLRLSAPMASVQLHFALSTSHSDGF